MLKKAGGNWVEGDSFFDRKRSSKPSGSGPERELTPS